MRSAKSKSDWRFVIAAIVAVIIVIGLWSVNWIVGCTGTVIKAPDNAGEFGDMFGVINALFSGLAFAGIIVAILMQRSELIMQRKELESTRAELRATRLISGTNSIIFAQYLDAPVPLDHRLSRYKLLGEAIEQGKLERKKDEGAWDKLSAEDKKSEQNAVAYNTARAIEKVGNALSTGQVSARYVFTAAGARIIEDWILCSAHVKSLQQAKASEFQPVDRNGFQIYWHRRHAEWLAALCALWFHKRGMTGIIEPFIECSRVDSLDQLTAFVQALTDPDSLVDLTRDEIKELLAVDLSPSELCAK